MDQVRTCKFQNTECTLNDNANHHSLPDNLISDITIVLILLCLFFFLAHLNMKLVHCNNLILIMNSVWGACKPYNCTDSCLFIKNI